MAQRTITALFDRYEDASNAVSKLEQAGIPHGDISLVANNEGDRYAAHANRTDADRTDTAESASTGAGTGATLGTVLGGGAGLLAGLGLLAIPGVGPVVAAGWLVATLAGAGVGAAAGGLAGSLTGAGLSETEAHTYAEGVRRGGSLVTVRADDAQAARVTDILDDHGRIDLDERTQNWRSQGWTGTAGTGNIDTPVTGATREIGSTGIGAAASSTTGVPYTDGTTDGRRPFDDASVHGIAGASREGALRGDETPAPHQTFSGTDRR